MNWLPILEKRFDQLDERLQKIEERTAEIEKHITYYSGFAKGIMALAATLAAGIALLWSDVVYGIKQVLQKIT